MRLIIVADDLLVVLFVGEYEVKVNYSRVQLSDSAMRLSLSVESADLHMINPQLAHKVAIKQPGSQ